MRTGSGTRQLARGCVIGCAIGLAVLLTGCGGPPEQPRSPETEAILRIAEKSEEKLLDPDALQGDLISLITRIHTETVGMSSEIAAGTRSRAVREASVRAKIHSSAFLDSMMIQPDPRRAFLYAWIGLEEVLFYLTEGNGQTDFGAFQDEAVQGITASRNDIIALGYRHFDKEVIDEARDDVQVLARRQVLRSDRYFADRRPFHIYDGASQGNNDLFRIIGAPVGALQGAANTPVAIQDMAGVVTVISRVMQNMPERARWQMELLMLEAESLESVQAALADTRRLTESVERATVAIETLPDEVRATLDHAEQQQPAFQKTITELRETTEQLNTLAAAIDTAAISTEKLFVQINALAGVDPDAPPSAPRDPDAPVRDPIRDLIELAEGLTVAVAEARGLLTDLDQPMQQADTLSAGTIDRAAQTTADLINAIAWRAAGLLVLAFVLALLYRVITKKKA